MRCERRKNGKVCVLISISTISHCLERLRERKGMGWVGEGIEGKGMSQFPFLIPPPLSLGRDFRCHPCLVMPEKMSPVLLQEIVMTSKYSSVCSAGDFNDSKSDGTPLGNLELELFVKTAIVNPQGT